MSFLWLTYTYIIYTYIHIYIYMNKKAHNKHTIIFNKFCAFFLFIYINIYAIMQSSGTIIIQNSEF